MEVSMTKISICRILNKYLGLRKVAARFIHYKLTDEQELHRIQHSEDVKKVKKNKNCVYNIVTGDKTWWFWDDQETKHKRAEWKAAVERNPKNPVWRSRK